MKKLNILLLTLCLPVLIFCQNMKPSIMVIPADIYMTKKGWVDKHGEPDYHKAFKNDNNIRLAIAQLGEFMNKREFLLVNLEQQLKALKNESIRNENYEGRDGDQIQLNLLDEIFQSTQPDIVMDLDFSMSGGMKKTLEYTLQGLDSYTYKLISSTSGTGPGSATNDISALLQVAIKDNMDNFCTQLTNHFLHTQKVGREIRIQIKVNSDDVYLDDEYVYDPYDMDDELTYIIEEWFYRNAKKGMYKTKSTSSKVMKIGEIRIPTTDDRGRALDANRFITPLRKMLKKPPFNITCKVEPVGLAEAWLILGNK